MVVHSDEEGEATADYLLSQQLQEQGILLNYMKTHIVVHRTFLI